MAGKQVVAVVTGRVHTGVRGAVAVAVLFAALAVLAAGDAPTDRAGAAVDRPNVLLIFTDDQRADTFPSTAPIMPNLQARVDDPGDEWVHFPNAYVNTSLCCPARATLYSGQRSDHTGVTLNRLAGTFREGGTLATWLDAVGYQTAHIGKYFNGYPFNVPHVPPGWDRFVGMDFTTGDGGQYFDYTLVEDGVEQTYGASESDYLTDVLADHAVDYLTAADADEPWFLYFAPLSGHHPFDPAPRHVGALDGVDLGTSPAFDEADVSDKPTWIQELNFGPGVQANALANRQAAAETLLSADEAIERLLDEVEARGETDETVVFFVSDHGHAFGEHRWTGKRCIYDECHEIPFLVRWPGAAAGSRDQLVTLADITATIVGLAGADATHPIEGVDLTGVLDSGSGATHDEILYLGVSEADDEEPGYWAIRTLDWLYAELDTGEVELYDDVADPWQLENLANDPAYAGIRSALAAQLDAAIAEDPRPNDTTRPTISISTPASGSTVEGPVTITGTAGDDRGVTFVDLRITDLGSGQELRPDNTFGPRGRLYADLADHGGTTTAWSFTFDPPAGSGIYEIRARAEDAAGNGRADTVVVEVGTGGAGNQAPVVTVTDPSYDEVVPSPVTIRGTATDDGGVASVEVGVQDRSNGTWLRPDGSFASGIHWFDASLADPGEPSTDFAFTAALADGNYGTLVRTTDDEGVRGPDRPWVRFAVEGTTGGGDWVEDFALPNGTTSDTGPTAWSISYGGSGTASVQGGELTFNDTDGVARWTSETIDLSGGPANVSLTWRGTGPMESGDTIRAAYRIDGGPLTRFAENADSFATETVETGPLTGSTVQVVIEAYNTFSDEFHVVEEVAVRAATAGPWSDDFETDRGWTIDPYGTDTASTGRWEVANPEQTSSGGVVLQPGTTTSCSQALVTQAAAGSSAGSYDIDGGVTSALAPPIIVPPGADLRFSWAFGHLTNATSADFLRVSVVTGSGTAVVLDQRGSATNRSGSWSTFSTSLASYAGQSIRILVQAADASSGSLIEAAIDDLLVG